MTWLWALLGIMVVLIVASLTYVGIRDRRRTKSGDAGSAARQALSEAERYAAERHAAQGRDPRSFGSGEHG
ncbi:hypothetical protein AB0J80_19145 [Actinoplanes sp. NPDC049548]|uniref:hypothetical protein n=1 Tax=Actinoplanes sp. NPDC049548 TaxID=3155152 RepID=UPI003420A93B